MQLCRAESARGSNAGTMLRAEMPESHGNTKPVIKLIAQASARSMRDGLTGGLLIAGQRTFVLALR